MKINIQKTKNRFISILGAVIVFVSCVTFSVSADYGDPHANVFVDFNDYASYSFPTDSDQVVVDVRFPDDWIYSWLYRGDGENPWQTIYRRYIGNSFYTDTIYDYLSLRMLPMGGNTCPGDGKGFQVEEAYFIDMRYLPKDTTFNYRFSLTVENDSVDLADAYCRCIRFVDENGIVVGLRDLFFKPTESKNGNTVTFTWEESISLSSAPDTAVGFFPMFLLYEVPVSENGTKVSLESFGLSFPMSGVMYQSQQNEKLQSTMENVQKALEEQNKKADDIINGTPEQNQQVGDSVGSLNNKTDELGELGDQLNSVEKPKINSADFSATALVPGSSLKVLAMPFQALWENEILLAILTVVVSLVLVSWVFFGKKR